MSGGHAWARHPAGLQEEAEHEHLAAEGRYGAQDIGSAEAGTCCSVQIKRIRR